MDAKAGWSIRGAGRLGGAEKRGKPKKTPAKTGGGSVVTAGKNECGPEPTWSLRWELSTTAGYCAVCRSSVTEITGNRIRMSMARATNCFRPFAAVRGANRSHTQIISEAVRIHPRLRTNSMLSADSKSECIPNKNMLLVLFDATQRPKDEKFSSL